MTICEHKKYNINHKGKEKRISLLSSYSLNIFGHLVLGNLQTLSLECKCCRVTMKPWGATGYNDLHQSQVEIAFKAVTFHDTVFVISSLILYNSNLISIL